MMLKAIVAMALAAGASGEESPCTTIGPTPPPKPCTTVAPTLPPTPGPVHCDTFDCASPCAIGGAWDPKPNPEAIFCPGMICDKKLCCVEPTTTPPPPVTCAGYDCHSPCAIGGAWDDKTSKDSITCSDRVCDKEQCCDPPTTTTFTTTTTTTTTTLETCCSFDCQAPCAIGGPWYTKQDSCETIDCVDGADGVCDKKLCCDPPTTTTFTTTTTTTTTTLETCALFDCGAPCAIGGPWDNKPDMDKIKCMDNEPSFACDKKFCCLEPTTTTLISCSSFTCPDDMVAKAPASGILCASNHCDASICCVPPPPPTTENPCATIGTPAPNAPPAPASPCTTIIPSQRLYSEAQQQISEPKPLQAATQSWLPALGMFAACALLGGFAVSLYRRRARTTRTLSSDPLARRLAMDDDMAELGELSTDELLVE